jgi:chaperonin GroEL
MADQTLLYAPDSLRGIARGVDRMAELLALTLGPNTGVIYNATGPGKPERLTDAGIISRRVTELASRPQNVGAMIVRGMAMELQEKYGDGTATAAVLTRALVRQAVRQITAGANPMRLRHGMSLALDAALQALAADATPAADQPTLEALVMTATGDAELSTILGEMFDLLGKYGTFMVEEYAAPTLDREYIDGGRWRARPASRLLLPPGGDALVLHNPLIAIIDEKLESFARLRPLLELVMHAPDKPPLLLVCKEIKGEALNGLSANYKQGVLSLAVAVSTLTITRIPDDLDDMALLAGAQVLRDATGRPPERVRLEYLGHARQITLERDSLTIVGGAGDKAAMQKRVSELQKRVAQRTTPDEDWEHLRLRVARMAGSTAILKVGGYTAQERDARKATARQAVRMLELAMNADGGVLPGSGAAYLDAIPAALACLDACADEDERHGVEAVVRALEAPFLQIVRNHGGAHPPVALAQAREAGRGHGFDARSGKITPMLDAGIIDSHAVLRAALAAAVSAAGTAITTDMIVFHSRR